MALSPVAVISVLEAREFLGAEPDGERLNDVINAATEFCEKEVEGPIVSRTITDEVFDGTGDRELALTSAPVTAVSAVKVLVAEAPVDFDPIDLALYPVIVITPGRRRIAFRNRTFPRGFQNVQVTYTAGYDGVLCPMPSLLKEACRQVVKELYAAKDDDGVASITVGGPTGAQTTTYAQRVVPDKTIDALRKFRKARYR